MASSSDNVPAAPPPRPGAGPGSEINPQLENVLHNLNVNLEDELSRYRRQRHGRIPPPPPRRGPQRQSIDLISVSASTTTDEAPAPSSPGSPPPPPPPPPNPFLNQEPRSTDTDLTDIANRIDADLAGTDLTDPSINDIDVADTEIEPELAPSAPTTETLPVRPDSSPEGYLESSEELLKSIAEEQAEETTPPKPYSPKGKNNPLLKLAALMLVLIGGVGVGFAITYPSQLKTTLADLRSHFPLPGSIDTAVPTDTEVETDTPETTSTTLPDSPEATADSKYKPPGPDLSTREFVELDLESLSTLDVDGTTTPAPSSPIPPVASPIPGQPPTVPTTAAPASPSAPAPTTEPPTTPTPATVSLATPPATTTAAKPTAATGSNFYVIANYTGDASLSKAREVVPDAFVRNFKAGARIQLAAFDNLAQAEDQVSALGQRGIAVQLFGPTNE